MVKRPSLAGSVKRNSGANSEEAADKIKVTFELEEPIYTRFRIFALHRRMPGREVLKAALEDYLAKHDTTTDSKQRQRGRGERRTIAR